MPAPRRAGVPAGAALAVRTSDRCRRCRRAKASRRAGDLGRGRVPSREPPACAQPATRSRRVRTARRPTPSSARAGSRTFRRCRRVRARTPGRTGGRGGSGSRSLRAGRRTRCIVSTARDRRQAVAAAGASSAGWTSTRTRCAPRRAARRSRRRSRGRSARTALTHACPRPRRSAGPRGPSRRTRPGTGGGASPGSASSARRAPPSRFPAG